MSVVEWNAAAPFAPGYDPPAEALDISFFVPCFNEEPNVVGAIEKLVQVCAKLRLSYEILVFDDCSHDRSVEVVKNFQASNPLVPVRLFVNTVNRGVARNFFDGAFHAHGRHYRLVCGDDIEPIESHEHLLRQSGRLISSCHILLPSKAGHCEGTSCRASLRGSSTRPADIVFAITTGVRSIAVSTCCAFTWRRPASAIRPSFSPGLFMKADR